MNGVMSWIVNSLTKEMRDRRRYTRWQPEINNVDSEIFIVYRTVRMLAIGKFNYFGGPPTMR